MTVEFSITGNPAECRNAIYQMRLMRDIFIADIYEERPGNSVQEWYCVIMDRNGNPRWSLVNLPDPESFFEAVRNRSWPGRVKIGTSCKDCELNNGGEGGPNCMFDYDPSDCPVKEGKE